MNIMDHINSFLADFSAVTLFPIVTVVLLLLFFIYYIVVVPPQRGTSEWINMEVDKTKLNFFSRRYPLRKKDIAPLLIITIFFLALAVFNLGDTTAVDVLSEIETPAETRTHMDNIYFDEVYHVRTAVEHIENIDPYEISHPPLGKEIIAASILIFGMSPFGWRLMGAVFGVILLTVMYIFIRNMFGKTIVAICGTLLLGFDFMRFVQTRIATIDAYAVLFILLAFFFMYRHVTTGVNAGFRKSLLPLALSGFFFGLSCAVKWLGFYAGAGLLIIYAIRLIQLGVHYKSAGKRGFSAYLVKTILFTLLFFVIVPAITYYLSFIPYGLARGLTLEGGMLWDVRFLRFFWDNQVSMYMYHSRLVATHPFSSQWWQWVLNTHPILYVNGSIDGARATFGAFGNPVVWWGGLLAVITMALRVFTHRDGKALFILIGYLSLLLPWLAVTRILFIYHYFPCTLFLVLALSHIFNTIIERKKKGYKLVVYAYTALAGIVFAMFYPALSGMYMPGWYYENLLKWLSTWPL